MHNVPNDNDPLQAETAMQGLPRRANSQRQQLSEDVASYVRELIISGRVTSYYLKQLAQETIRNAPHVTQIANHIEVVSR